MRENGPLFQHCYFFHDKFLVNDEYLQIHECWYGHVVEKTAVNCGLYRRFYSMLEVHLSDFAHNVGQWIILNHAIVYDERIGCYIYGYVLLTFKAFAKTRVQVVQNLFLSKFRFKSSYG